MNVHPQEEQRWTMKRGKMTMQQQCQESKTWAEWAPGFKRAVCLVVRKWVATMAKPGERVCKISPMSLEQWRRHFEADHLPARRDCKFCVQSQARSKAHRRISHPQAFTLSLDLSGKLSPGTDQCPSGKKKGQYILIGVYTFPVTGNGKSLIPCPGEGEPRDQPFPEEGALLTGDEADPREADTVEHSSAEDAKGDEEDP